MELAEIVRLFRAGRKIDAIKLYRGLTGAGLAVAKNAVEQHAARSQITSGAEASQVYNLPDSAKAASYAMKVVAERLV
jgi:ribosomal protein L7/L12